VGSLTEKDKVYLEISETMPIGDNVYSALVKELHSATTKQFSASLTT